MSTWVSYRHDGTECVGVVENGKYVPLVGIRRIDCDHGLNELRNADLDYASAVDPKDVELLPVSWAPQRVLCVGLNYRDHVAETKRDLPTYPVLFAKYASTLIAADRPVSIPPESDQVDYEGELAVVIGRAGRRISAADALDHVLGYTVANDITMRDYQYKTHQWVQGKAWDDTTPLGPHLVSPDEVDLSTSSLRTIVDGVVVQESPLSMLIFDIASLIATISEFTRLQPGDVILTGTPGGVGFRREPQLFLQDASVVSVEIDGIGRIETSIVRDGSGLGAPSARDRVGSRHE